MGYFVIANRATMTISSVACSGHGDACTLQSGHGSTPHGRSPHLIDKEQEEGLACGFDHCCKWRLVHVALASPPKAPTPANVMVTRMDIDHFHLAPVLCLGVTSQLEKSF